MARRAVAWLLAGAMLLVVLLLAWTAFVAPPTAGGLRTGDPPRDAQPAASAAAGAADGEPSSAERAPVASSTITVSGRIVDAKDRGVVWLGERRELGFARFTAEDGFAVRCVRPLAQVRLRAIDARGAGRTWDFARPEGDAASPWDLGEIQFGGADVAVDLTIEYDPHVVRRMLATKQQRIVVELREERANGPLVASTELDLATFAATTRASFTRTVQTALASAAADLYVSWTCTVDRHGARN